jgi:N-acetylmuramoyl-L-alanine amidase
MPHKQQLTFVVFMLKVVLLSAGSLRTVVADPIVRSAETLGHAAAPEATSCDPKKFKIAIDVGHTVEVSGAISARGITEYVFNLKLAKQIDANLRDAGFVQTHLIITRGVGSLQLQQRSARANAMGGVDLFVSIHHDDVQPIYYSKWDYNGKTYHFSDKFAGYSIFVSYQNRFKTESLNFAELLAEELMARDMHFTTHHAEDVPGERREFLDPQRGVYRYDQLIVLKNTNAPAVLLEAGVIVNRAEEAILPRRHGLISAAVLQATIQFCSQIQSKRTPQNP